MILFSFINDIVEAARGDFRCDYQIHFGFLQINELK